jgi:hypothetical protein
MSPSRVEVRNILWSFHFSSLMHSCDFRYKPTSLFLTKLSAFISRLLPNPKIKIYIRQHKAHPFPISRYKQNHRYCRAPAFSKSSQPSHIFPQGLNRSRHLHWCCRQTRHVRKGRHKHNRRDSEPLPPQSRQEEAKIQGWIGLEVGEVDPWCLQPSPQKYAM